MTNDSKPNGPAPVGRRDAIARLAGGALSLLGITAFGRYTPAVLTDAPTDAPTRARKWDDRFELAVDLEIAPPEGARYHRPYVAVWVEDAAGKPVRTLSLWVNTTGRGPRYIRELRRWFFDTDQGSANGADLVATVSSATRLPGRYTVTWDGRDDRGKPVDLGTYRVLVEAAREHGSYGVIQQELKLGAESIAADLPGNDEIARARVEYRRKK